MTNAAIRFATLAMRRMSPSPRTEPMFNAPLVVTALVAIMVAIHLARLMLDTQNDAELIVDWGFIPVRAWMAIDGTGARAVLDDLVRRGTPAGAALEDARAAWTAIIVREDAVSRPWTFLTYGFLHADAAHLSVNSIALLAFGSAVARRFGAVRFLTLTVLGIVAGAATHGAIDHGSTAPLIGASAGVSALIGAAARFVFVPGGPLSGRALPGDVAYRLPARGILSFGTERRALQFVIVWLAVDFAIAMTSQAIGMTDGSIAWLAHLGGFAAGLVGFSALDPVRRANLA